MPRERLWAWVHAECGDAEATEIATHVADCPACASSVSEMRELAGDLADLGADTAHWSGSAADDARAGLPERIGGYRVLRKLGEGGMGVVFEAEQQSPQRAVALKVVRGGYTTDAFSLKLFQREAQTLGRLNHPGIAAVYEAGVADGQHFFAMELVAGRPLGDYVARPAGENATPLALRGRLELFHEVCRAIAYAHQSGVVHRDLKPSNILVTPAGRPKVLDFGLARIVEGEQPLVTAVSETGKIMGTLPYMSPEQARGAADGLDVRCDVYALGVVLYELLTGELPFPAWGRPMHEVVRDICERPPRAPRALNAAVPADVDTICRKALAKEPERRYQSAAELADDVERYLTRRPIRARPASAGYHFRKFVERNALAVGLVSVIFVVVLAAAVLLGLQARELAIERDIARREATKFEEINRVLTAALQSPDPWRQGDRDTTVLELLDELAARIEAELRSDPLVAAAVRRTLGQTYRAYSLYDEAAPHMAFVYETWRAAAGEAAPETIAALESLAEIRYLQDRLDESRTLYEQARALRTRHLPADAVGRADVDNSLGLIAVRAARWDAARDLLEAALETRTTAYEQADAAQPARDPTWPDARAQACNELAQTHNNLGVLRRRLADALAAEGKPHAARIERHAAEPHYARALELRRACLGEDHPETAKMYNNYGRVLEDLGRPAEAERMYAACLAALLDKVGEDHAYTVMTLLNLGAARVALGELQAADEALTRCAAIIERLLPADHPLRAELAGVRAAWRAAGGG